MHYGIDIGGTKIELTIFDKHFNSLDSWRILTPQDGYQPFVASVINMINEADKKSGVLGSIGIGIPGVIDQQGNILSANINCISGKPLTKDLSSALSRPIAFQNDMNMFALSEACGGSGEGKTHVLGLILGTGLGAGLCINQNLYLGKSGFAREIGHLPMPAILEKRYGFPIKACGCGLSSCLEQYLSGPGLLWMSSFFGGEFDTAIDFVKAFEKEDPVAQKTFAAYIDCLGCYFAQLTLIFDPDVVVLGGGLSNIKQIYQQLPEAITQYLFAGAMPPKIIPPKFGDSSGVRGAALLGSRIDEKKSDF